MLRDRQGAVVSGITVLRAVRGTCRFCGMATRPRVYVTRLAAGSMTALPQPEYAPWVAHVRSRSVSCADADGRYWASGATVPQDGPVMDAARSMALLAPAESE